MTKLGFDDFFTFPDHTTRINVEMSLIVDNKQVIPHPLFPFEPRTGSQIYHAVIKSSWEDLSLFDLFLLKFSELAHSSVDQTWSDTGFWTMSNGEHDCTGIGLDSLSHTMSEKSRGHFSCCLARIDMIIILSSKFEYAILKDTELDVYITNPDLSSAKAIRFLQDATREVGRCQVVEQALESSDICSHYYEGRVRLHNPNAVIKGVVGYPVMAVLKNPFFGKENVSIGQLEYFLGQGKCGFTESDFDGKVEFSA